MVQLNCADQYNDLLTEKTSEAITNTSFFQDAFKHFYNLSIYSHFITTSSCSDIELEAQQELAKKNVKLYFSLSDRTTIDLSINKNKKKILSIKDHGPINNITPLYLKTIQGVFTESEYILISTNLRKDTVTYLFDTYKD